MIKSILKIVIAVLIANALWRAGSSYLSYYKFEDAVSELALHDADRTDGQIKDRVLELAATYDEPVDADALQVSRDEQRLIIETSYTKPVALLPGFEYQWPFSLRVERPFINAPALR